MRIIHGDCVEVLAGLPPASVDSVVTDPPYGLSFMGKSWDYDVPQADVWREVLRVLKPGGHLLSFFGTRTYHRGVVKIEDAGFEIRDQIGWAYGSGFPKSMDVSKAIDKDAGVEREFVGVGAAYCQHIAAGKECPGHPTANRSLGGGPNKHTPATAPSTDAAKKWHGWGTALKPAWEPIVVARKPLVGTVAENVLAHGCGALNVDGCRVGTEGGGTHCDNRDSDGKCLGHQNAGRSTSGETFHGPDTNGGRWPANLCHDGSEEVLGCFPNTKSGARFVESSRERFSGWREMEGRDDRPAATMKIDNYGDSGSAARFFYCAKASKKDRDEGLEHKTDYEHSGPRGHTLNGDGTPRPRPRPRANTHPTVKPTDLMRWLVRLVTPPGGTVLDPFCGSGSTGKAAKLEGFSFIGIEREEEYVRIAQERINATQLHNQP